MDDDREKIIAPILSEIEKYRCDTVGGHDINMDETTRGKLIAIDYIISIIQETNENATNMYPNSDKPNGKWIKIDNWMDVGIRCKCSECGQVFVLGDQVSRNYCGNCGAKMVESQESEVKNDR